MDTARNSGIDVSKTLGSGGPAGSYFPDPGHYQQQKSRRRKWLVLGVGFAFLGLAIAGATVGGIIRSRRAAKTDLANTSANASIGGGDGADVVKQSDPSDPSTFIKDPNLHQSFYGIAYSPQNSQLPGCGATLPEVITDIQLLAQLTKRIRLYGADCNQTALVLEAIQQTKVDMQVWLGNYPIPTDGGEAYVRQRDLIRDALTTYGADHISGITVGNEFMLNYITSHNSSNPNSAIGNQGAALLISNITDTRNMLRSMNLHTTIPVGNSDAGSYFNNHVLAAIDYGLANVHPWFANVSIQQSGAWTTNFFESVDIAAANAQSNKPKMYIAETGWPSKSSDVAHASNGPSRASIGNLQSYLDTFVCQANSAGTPYFYFELYDEAWKDAQFGGVEGWWGLFTANGSMGDNARLRGALTSRASSCSDHAWHNQMDNHSTRLSDAIVPWTACSHNVMEATFVLVLTLRRALKRSKVALILDARHVAREVKEPEHDFDEYDFVIIGGGTAGCVLASRLSEDPTARVILLEAGERAQFGAPGDWDQWGDIIGDPAWKWDNFQRYFRKMETFVPHPDFPSIDLSTKGQAGPVKIGYFSDASEGSKLFIKSATKLGIPYSPDFNTSKGTLGVNKIMTYIDESRKRVSSESAYLTKDVLARPNLKVLVNATVTKVITDRVGEDVRALGVEFSQAQSGPRFRVRAKQDVIVSAGAVQSPHVLMLSGIGPSAELKKHHIPVVVDIPGVGENLVDHPVVGLYYKNRFADSPTHVKPSTIPQVFQLISSVVQYLTSGTGALTTNWGEAAAFVRSDDKKLFPRAEFPERLHDTTSASNSPDLEIFTTPLAYKEHGEWQFPMHTFGIHTVLLRPKSKGAVRLKSADPWDAPSMDPKYLTEKEDVAKLVRGVHLVSKIAHQEPLASRLDHSDKNPLLDSDTHLKTDAELEDLIRDRVETLYHPTSTCRMAPFEQGGVVDSHLRVYGVKGLRVCDASIFPEIPSGHTAGATLAASEHLADIIKAELGIAPSSSSVAKGPEGNDHSDDQGSATEDESELDRRVVIQGVSLTLPLPTDLYFRRVVRGHIEPFPPLSEARPDGSRPVPILVLCLPFTEEDQLRYAGRFKLEVKAPLSQRLAAAMLHLRQSLPQKYNRWVTIDEYTRAVVLATNESKSDLALAFDLDMLEEIRRLMGVRWIPTWNLPESDIHTHNVNNRATILPSLFDWPEDLPCCPDLTWEGLQILPKHRWDDLWNMVEVRLETYARVKGGEIPDSETPMAESFQLVEPVYTI